MEQSPKRQKLMELDETVVLLLALGYNPITIMMVRWFDRYAEQTCLISKAFYEAYKNLHIYERVVVEDYVRFCNADHGCKPVHYRNNPALVPVVCGTDVKVDILFLYSKLYKFLVHMVYNPGTLGGLRIAFEAGVPVMYKESNGPILKIGKEKERLLVPIISKDNIVLSHREITVPQNFDVNNVEYLRGLDYAFKAGYSDYNHRMAFVKDEPRTFVRNRIMVMFGGEPKKQVKLPEGVDIIYCFSGGIEWNLDCCIDRFGISDLYVYDDYGCAFEPHEKHSEECFGIQYSLDLLPTKRPLTEAEAEAKHRHFWNFSTRIPRYLLINDVEPCCEKYIEP